MKEIEDIGIDLDEVSINYMDPFCEWHNLNYGTSLTRKDIFSYDFHEPLRCSPEEGLRRVLEFQRSSYFENLKPFDDAISGIETLAKDSNLYIITSRLVEFGEQTQKHIKLLPDVFSGVYTTGAHPGNYPQKTMKSSICKRLGITMILEDVLEETFDCADNGIRVLLFDRPWNQATNLKEHITRVNSWQDALEKI